MHVPAAGPSVWQAGAPLCATGPSACETLGPVAPALSLSGTTSRSRLNPAALTAELNMYESKIQEYKSDNQVLINQLQDIKKKYLSLKQQHR
ncbi:unnamed protein product [Boreogadus saida]